MAVSEKKVALVTGASSGIGRACADLLAARGYRVYGASRRPAESSLFESISMDIRNDASARAAVAAVLAREGRIDVLVNNAGIAIAGSVEDTSLEEAHDQFDVNFFGVLRMCRSVLPVMREQGVGYIVNIGSIAGLVAVPYQGLYSASKFALEGLAESLRLEVGRFGVRVVLIEPGDHRTNLTDNRRRTTSSDAYRDRFERAVARMEADEKSGPEPASVARLLLRIVGMTHPRLRYTTGPAAERAAIWLKRLLPYAVVERVMNAWYSR